MTHGPQGPRRAIRRGSPGLAQDLDAGESLALQPFEESAASGRDECKIIGDAGMMERRDRLATAGDGEKLACFSAFCRMTRRGNRRLVEGLNLEGAERTIPDECRRLVDPAVDDGDRLRAD